MGELHHGRHLTDVIFQKGEQFVNGIWVLLTEYILKSRIQLSHPHRMRRVCYGAVGGTILFLFAALIMIARWQTNSPLP